jgi:hypothetical protein
VAKAKPKSNAAAFRSPEAELADLCRNEHQTAEAAAKAEERIKAICDLANFPERLSFGGGERLSLGGGERLSFGEHFIRLLRKRWRSSQDFFDYFHEHNGLLVRLGEISAEKRKRILEDARWQRAARNVNRDRQIVQEYVQERKLRSDKDISDSALKAEIGERHGVKRSASIEIINRGLKLKA